MSTPVHQQQRSPQFRPPLPPINTAAAPVAVATATAPVPANADFDAARRSSDISSEVSSLGCGSLRANPLWRRSAVSEEDVPFVPPAFITVKTTSNTCLTASNCSVVSASTTSTSESTMSFSRLTLHSPSMKHFDGLHALSEVHDLSAVPTPQTTPSQRPSMSPMSSSFRQEFTFDEAFPSSTNKNRRNRVRAPLRVSTEPLSQIHIPHQNNVMTLASPRSNYTTGTNGTAPTTKALRGWRPACATPRDADLLTPSHVHAGTTQTQPQPLDLHDYSTSSSSHTNTSHDYLLHKQSGLSDDLAFNVPRGRATQSRRGVRSELKSLWGKVSSPMKRSKGPKTFDFGVQLDRTEEGCLA